MIEIDPIPVAVKFFEELPLIEFPRKNVRSFCEALWLVRNGEYPEGLMVTPESIAVCSYSHVALGFRGPATAADAVVPSIHPHRVAAVVVYPYRAAGAPTGLSDIAFPPDSIVLIADEENTRAIVETLGNDAFDTQYADLPGFSAMATFLPGSGPQDDKSVKVRERRARRTLALNRMFGSKMMRKEGMVNFVTRLMGKTWMQNFMAWLSSEKSAMCASCLASTSVPRVSGKAHVGFLDAGSVGWGHVNSDRFLTGVTPPQFQKLQSELSAVLTT